MPKKDINQMDFDELYLDYKEEYREAKLLKLELEAYERHYDLKWERYLDLTAILQHWDFDDPEPEYSYDELNDEAESLWDDCQEEEIEINNRKNKLKKLLAELWRKYRRLLRLRRQKKGAKKGAGKKKTTKKKGGKKKDIMKMSLRELKLDYKEEERELRLKELLWDARNRHFRWKWDRYIELRERIEQCEEKGDEKGAERAQKEANSLWEDMLKEREKLLELETEIRRLSREILRKKFRLDDLEGKKQGKKQPPGKGGGGKKGKKQPPVKKGGAKKAAEKKPTQKKGGKGKPSRKWVERKMRAGRVR